ncbi:MAG TPA: hypothetical protein VGL39_16415 [Jatrophihabitantaceae bacterium]|jgi:hypothetical protein
MNAPAESLAAGIEEVQLVVSADGARLDLIDADESNLVHLKLSLEDVSCADCVLPHDRLVDVIEASLRRHTGDNSLCVEIDDPRED